MSPLLEFDRVSLRYGRQAPLALRDLSFRVEPGERVALIGPSGAGKTSVLAMANSVVMPSEGQVRVLGIDTADMGRRRNRATRRHVSMIHQGNALVGPLRVAQNVAAGRLGYWNGWEALRSLVKPRDIEEILGALDDVGIPEKLWERADQLSGGQQQRVAVARSLYQRGRLVLADEPVSALDPARSDSIMDVLAGTTTEDGRALVTSLHDAPLALKHCTRVIGLRSGSVAFDKPVEEVAASDLERVYELDGQ